MENTGKSLLLIGTGIAIGFGLTKFLGYHKTNKSKSHDGNQTTTNANESTHIIYCPKWNAFNASDTREQLSLPFVKPFIDRHNFGQLILKTAGDHWKYVSIPFLIDDEAGTLVAHCAKGNGIWKHFNDQNTTVLIVFNTPHGYVSPSYYLKNEVPTWNYSTVLIEGHPRILKDKERNKRTLEKLVEKSEKDNHTDWSLSSLADDYVNKKMEGIVFFEITPIQIEGRAKLSQNKEREDLNGVIQAYEKKGAQYPEIAEYMKLANKDKLN